MINKYCQKANVQVKCTDCGAPMELSRSNDTVVVLVCSKKRTHRSLHAPDDLVKAIQKMVADFNLNDERRKMIDQTNAGAALFEREQKRIDNGVEVAQLVEAIEKAQFNYYRSMTTQEASKFLCVHRITLLDYVRLNLIHHHKIGKSYTFTMADLIEFRNKLREPKPRLK